MNVETASATAEAEVRETLARWEKAVRARDLAGIVSHYAPDIVAFDAIAKLQFKGVEAYRNHWEQCLSMCAGPMIFEIHDLHVAAGGEVAFAYALNRCGGTGPDGKEAVGWMRMTVGYRRTGGKWLAVHEHFSAPFDMENSKVLWLEP